jgi:hypothetical protein
MLIFRVKAMPTLTCAFYAYSKHASLREQAGSISLAWLALWRAARPIRPTRPLVARVARLNLNLNPPILVRIELGLHILIWIQRRMNHWQHLRNQLCRWVTPLDFLLHEHPLLGILD